MKQLTASNFKDEIKKGKTLVDFNADWCGPCQMQAPILEAMSKDYHIASLNIDDAPEIAEEYGVSSIPCLIIFKDGKEVRRKIGLTPESAIKKLMEQ
ncbi:thioredoxin [Candidatus Saccharibacteria bacterium]|nr:thioredoxin [Candidatus Saccharibacteria bacterium]